jgi:hypothetical protein
MLDCRATAMTARTRCRWGAIVACALVSLAALSSAAASDPPTLVIDQALTATSSDGRFPAQRRSRRSTCRTTGPIAAGLRRQHLVPGRL